MNAIMRMTMIVTMMTMMVRIGDDENHDEDDDEDDGDEDGDDYDEDDNDNSDGDDPSCPQSCINVRSKFRHIDHRVSSLLQLRFRDTSICFLASVRG